MRGDYEVMGWNSGQCRFMGWTGRAPTTIADALVDDREDADPTGLGERLQARRDVDAVAVKVVVFNAILSGRV